MNCWKPTGRSASFRGHWYMIGDAAYRSVAWIDDSTLFGLVSALDEEALFACADPLRIERARQIRL